MKLLSLSTYNACDSEPEQLPFDDGILDGISATTNRYDIHDNRHRKNTVPFLKSNYKYKRRVFPQAGARNEVARVVSVGVVEKAVIRPEQAEVRRSREVVAVGLIAISAAVVVVLRDILLSLLRRIVRAYERQAWCKNSSKIYCRLSEMVSEVKSNALRYGSRRHGGALALDGSRSFGLEYVSTGVKLIYVTLLIAFCMTAYEVEAGSCWTERIDNGKCKALYGNNMTKAQCCGKNQMFSYAEKNMSEVEYFFVLALGGGPDCKPCLESCKDIYCGPNKRCVKRKGRPKCICSPKCGSGKKHKKAHKRKHHQNQPEQQHIYQESGSLKPPHVIDISRSKEQVSLVNYHSPITVRDVRSLSSEIYNNPSAVSAMVLTNPDQPIFQLNSRRKNQRLSIASAKPTKNQATQQPPDTVAQQQQQHRLLHNLHHHHQDKVTRRRHANSDRNKGDKLIITADDLIRPSTERDNDLAESNSLRDKSSSTSDTRHPHQRHQQQHARHHFKKHVKPKRKIIDPNGGVAHNSVHNGTSPKAVAVAANITVSTTTTTTMPMPVSQNEMKVPERPRPNHRMQSFEVVTPSSTSSASSFPQQLFNKMHPPSTGTGTGTAINNKNNRDSYLPQDYADYLTFDDKIYNGFFSNGFPYPHQELLIDESRFAHPVCGTDGRTYNSHCQLKKRACRTDNPALVVAYRGHCQTSCKKVSCLNGLQCVEDHYAIPHCIVCAIECPMDDEGQKIDPARAVCGVDGNTYKSTCDINRMICKIGRSIAVAYPGPCREDRTTCSSVACGSKMTCLTDLLTHRPRCVSCKFKCSRKRRPTNIRYEEGKLCGTNNRTYNSWCEMKKDSCQTGFFVDIKSIGECQ